MAQGVVIAVEVSREQGRVFRDGTCSYHLMYAVNYLLHSCKLILLTALRILPIAYHLLATVYCLLRTIYYYLLPTTYYTLLQARLIQEILHGEPASLPLSTSGMATSLLGGACKHMLGSGWGRSGRKWLGKEW